jgi:hypothetical protein
MLGGAIFAIGLSVSTMLCECLHVAKTSVRVLTTHVEQVDGMAQACIVSAPHTPFSPSIYANTQIAVDIPPENLVPLLQANLTTRLTYVVALCLIKFSILVFYLRVDPRKWTRYAVYFLMCNVAGLSIATFFILLFVCSPPSLFWNPVAQAANPDKCMAQPRQQTFFETNGILK